MRPFNANFSSKFIFFNEASSICSPVYDVINFIGQNHSKWNKDVKLITKTQVVLLASKSFAPLSIICGGKDVERYNWLRK